MRRYPFLSSHLATHKARPHTLLREPDRKRGFRTPFGPVIPILSIVFCIVLMMGLEILTWIAFFIWLAIGLVIYFTYSRYRSEFARAR